MDAMDTMNKTDTMDSRGKWGYLSPSLLSSFPLPYFPHPPWEVESGPLGPKLRMGDPPGLQGGPMGLHVDLMGPVRASRGTWGPRGALGKKLDFS